MVELRRETRLRWWCSDGAIQVGFRESSSKERVWQKGRWLWLFFRIGISFCSNLGNGVIALHS